MPNIEEQIRKQIEDNKKSHWQKNREAGGDVEQREKYLKAKDQLEMKNGGRVKRKGVKNYKKGSVTLKNKKNPKYFIGGLLGIGAATMLGKDGPMGLAGILKRRKEEREKQGQGKIMTVRVVGGGASGGVGEKVNDKKLKEDDTASSEDKAKQQAPPEEANAHKGAVIKKRKFVGKYKDGGKPSIDVDKPSKINLKAASKEKPDIFSKPKMNTNASVDTNRQQAFMSNKDLNRQNQINKQQAFDKKMADQKRSMGTIGPPKHVQDAQAAARMNPVSALFAAPAQAVQYRQQQNREANMKKGGIARSGLWSNIHAKRKRIAAGSGEKMRKPGSKGAPTAKALRESKAEEGAVVYNRPKRTPSHPTKSHVVTVKTPGGGKKTIRFGQQGKTGDKTMTKRAKSFKARHGKNIAKGKTSAAYWANKVKW